MKEIKFTDKTKAKKIVDIALICGIFALCLITIFATNTSQNNDAATSSHAGTYPDKTEPEIISDGQKSEDAVSDVAEEQNANKPDDSTIEADMSVDNHQILPEAVEFMPPLLGSVIKVYSPDKPIYSATMDDWRIHYGVDVDAEEGTDVVSAESGIVQFCGFDSTLGYSVIVSTGEYECIYGSLESGLYVNEGQQISKGEIIGCVGDSMISEICDNTHLHFEMKKNGEYVNPLEYISFD